MRRYSELREQIQSSEGDLKIAAERAYAELAASTDVVDPGSAAQIVDAVWGDGLQVNPDVNRILGADAARTIEVEATRSRIAGLLTSTLIVHGEADPRPLWSVRVLADLLPNARLVPIPNAGHYPWFEQLDAFTRIIRDCLQNWPG